MPGKKFKTPNSKAEVARERKETSKRESEERKKKEEEDRYWQDDDKQAAKKQDKKVKHQISYAPAPNCVRVHRLTEKRKDKSSWRRKLLPRNF